jgi:hypothetical protein
MNGHRAELQRTLEQLERSVSRLRSESLDDLDFWCRYAPLARQALACASASDNQWMRDRIADIEGISGIINPNWSRPSHSWPTLPGSEQ